MPFFTHFFKFCINKLMEESVFNKFKQQLEDEGLEANSKESRDWFLDKIREIAEERIDRNSFKRKLPVAANYFIGRMYTFWYNPKGRLELPYYDRFPLVFMLEQYKGGFLGLNLHYLPVDLRQKLYYSLLPRATQSVFTDRTRLKIDYQYLLGKTFLRGHRPCLKRYTYKQIIGKVALVPAYEWEVAVHLPTALFRKAPESRVYKDSRILARKPV